MDAACLAVDGHGAGFYGARELDSLPDIFSMDDLLLDFGHDNAFPSPHHHHHHHQHKKFELPLPDSDAVDHNFPLFLIPCDDLAEAEWLSRFVDMSFSSEADGEDLLLFNPNMVKPGLKEEDMSLYGKRKQEEEQGEEVLEIRRSPFSVLESSSSSSCSYSSTSTTTVEQQEKENKNENENENKNENENENNKKKTMKMVAQTNPSPGRARSKRARISGPSSTAWASSRSALNLDCSSSFLIRTHNPTHHTSPSLSSSSSSSLLEMNCQNTKTKEMGRANLHEGDGQIDLKCLHCGSQKTPQWRAGPLGPKTLCNACGVRFKSGRLYPEYRPVASPSFVASVHSNSHKKVMEIRTLKQRSYYGTLPTPLAPPPNCNTTNSLPFLPKDYHLEDQWTLIRGTLN